MKPLEFGAAMRFVSRHFSIVGLGLVALSVILAILPLHDLFVDSPLHFQVHGPRFEYGGIEALVFSTAMVLACLFAGSVWARAVAMCAIGLLYLRLQYVDLPLICCLVYMEAMLATGKLLAGGWRRSGVHDRESMLHLLCGIGAYSVLLAALSLFHVAYPSVLYATVLCLGLLAAVITRHVPYSWQAVRSGVSGGWIERLAFALLFMTVLVMMAKTHLINDFDSWWYGLRSNYVFEQGGSIFTDLGLNHFVFYYPKLYEALMLPLFAFPDTSYPEALNIAFYVFILYVVHDMVAGIASGKALAAPITLLTGWVPVVIFTALLVKPDLFTALVLLIAARYLMRFITDGTLGDGFVGGGALAIALAAKLAAIPFGGLMFIVTALVMAVSIGRAMFGQGRGFVSECSGAQLTAFVLGLVTLAVFTYRTYSITGLPYIAPDFLREAFESLGFTTHFPYTDFIYKSIGGDWHFDWQSLGILYDALLVPSRLPHIVYSWIGNVFVLTALVAILTAYQWRKTAAFTRPFLLLCVPAFFMMLVFIAFLGKQSGGAGEYYVFPIILFTAISAASLSYARPWLRGGAIAALLLATVSNCFVWFAATPQWSGSTATYGMHLFRSTFASERQTESVLKSSGLSRIAQTLDQANQGGHCTALADGDEFMLFRLSCATESTHSLMVLGSTYLADTGAVSRYIAQAKFEFLVVPNIPQGTPLSKVYAVYAKLPGAVRIDDDLYSALDLRNVKQPLPVLVAMEQVPAQQPLSLMGYLPEMKASHPDASVDPLRAPFGGADLHLRKYLGTDAIVLRTGTVVEMDSDKIPFSCPGKLDFSLGLLPSDQISGVGDAGLIVSWSDGRDKQILGKVDLKVSPHGFEQQEISIGKCGRQLTTIMFRAYRGSGPKYAYVIMADPLLHK